MSDKEETGGNMYKPHSIMVTSGQFWRCAHGSTGHGKSLEWVGCDECKAEDPQAFKDFHKE